MRGKNTLKYEKQCVLCDKYFITSMSNAETCCGTCRKYLNDLGFNSQNCKSLILIFHKRFLSRFVVNHKDMINRLIGGAHDLLVACLAFVAANFFASDVLGFSLISGFAEKTLLFGACSGLVFYYFELNRGSWKYASIPDLIAIVKAATVVNVVYLLIAFFYSNSVGISRTIPILLWFFLRG